MKCVDDFRLRLGGRELVPIVIGGMGVDISTAELALEAARLGGIGLGTVAALEERVAALEGGRAAVASASGMAAEAMALMTILQQGDHVVAAGALYGGTVTMLAVNLAKFGIETSFVDATKPEAFAAAMRPHPAASVCPVFTPSTKGSIHSSRLRWGCVMLL